MISNFEKGKLKALAGLNEDFNYNEAEREHNDGIAAEKLIKKPVAKEKLRNEIYKHIYPLTTKMYRDDNWAAIYKIVGIMSAICDKYNATFNLTGSQYDPDGLPNKWKKWSFGIEFLNQRGNDDSLAGFITASGAGNQKDPLSLYDITVTF
jgi:hypothetical protein